MITSALYLKKKIFLLICEMDKTQKKILSINYYNILKDCFYWLLSLIIIMFLLIIIIIDNFNDYKGKLYSTLFNNFFTKTHKNLLDWISRNKNYVFRRIMQMHFIQTKVYTNENLSASRAPLRSPMFPRYDVLGPGQFRDCVPGFACARR